MHSRRAKRTKIGLFQIVKTNGPRCDIIRSIPIRSLTGKEETNGDDAWGGNALKRERKKGRAERWLFWILLVTLAFSLVYAVVRVVVTPPGPVGPEEFAKTRSDYVLMLIQCMLGLGVMFLPSLLEKRWRIVIPSAIVIMYFVFLYAAIYLGEFRSFYFLVPKWDLILHSFSGLMLGALGFSVVNLLNQSDKISLSLSPLFVALFAFCFAIACGVIWEFYEYTLDGLLHLNMQKFMLEDGTLLVGRAALADTMEDLLVDAGGALIMSVVGYLSLKRKSGWLEWMSIRRLRKKQDDVKQHAAPPAPAGQPHNDAADTEQPRA